MDVSARFVAIALLAGCLVSAGCSDLRVTNPPRTADEQFLQSEAIREAVAQLSFAALRDRRVYLDTSLLYRSDVQALDIDPEYERLFLVGELRNRMLIEGVALSEVREDADIVVEARTGGIGVNLQSYVLGVTGAPLPVGSVDVGSLEIPIVLPEFAILRNLEQRGYAAVSITAFWRDTGELVSSSGPFFGKTERTDIWFFGIGPSTSGDIFTVEE
jgi:hypothetical protein